MGENNSVRSVLAYEANTMSLIIRLGSDGFVFPFEIQFTVVLLTRFLNLACYSLNLFSFIFKRETPFID